MNIVCETKLKIHDYYIYERIKLLIIIAYLHSRSNNQFKLVNVKIF